MNETIVIYHGGCRDGFCAAWVVNKYFTMEGSRHRRHETGVYPVTYHPGFYGQEPPDVKDKNVIIVDFCYPLAIMQNIIANCKSLIWLDHHKTAQPVADWLMKGDWNLTTTIKWDFDNNRSGAGIAWDYFFPNEPRPWIVDYVEDRDLWANKLPASNMINAYIACLNFKFSVWDEVSEVTDIQKIVQYGIIAHMKTEQYVREVCKNVYFVDMTNPNIKLVYEWLKIPTVNICQVDCSEVLAELLKLYPQSPFSLYWFKRADGMYQYGLRSIGDFDVSSIAKLFGGGGHKSAAGFQLNYLLEELK